MKKLISLVFGVLFLFAPSVMTVSSATIQSTRYILNTSPFRDVSPNSKLRPALDWAVKNGYLEAGGFFRANEPMPAVMFWPLVLQEAGFDKNSATFNTPLPPNVSENDPIAQFLREAIRRDFVSPEDEFDPLKNITQQQALSVLVKTKAFLPPRRTSSAFQTKFDMLPSNRSEYFSLLETAFASNMISEQDVKEFSPNKPISRGTVVQWLYRFATEGEKQSILRPLQSPIKLVTKQKNALQKKQEAEENEKTTTIQIIHDTEKSDVTTKSLPEEFDILETVFAELKTKYRFPEQLTPKKKKDMIDAATEAMVRELGDKFTTYIKPAQSKEYEDGLNGEIEGIGAYVEMIDGKVFITAPITGSPAEASGIMPGDIITHVDGVDIANESLNDSVLKIKGPSGTTVTLKILRGTQTVEISVIRGRIKIPSITLKWIKSVPVIGIHQFDHSTSETLLEKINEEILVKNPRGIILDFRNNPGGYLTEAMEMGEIFLKNGQKVFSTEFNSLSNNYVSARDGELKDMNKIIVLQNKGTASASEIIISALKDYNRIKIVGETSYGKGVVQNLSQYKNGGILKITVAKWLSPHGTWLNNQGIKPDIEVVAATMEQRQEQIDPQLDRAVQELLEW